MTTTLITGGNKGLGREAARRLIEAGHDVWIGARDAGRGQEAADALGAKFVQLDVTDDASVAAAAATLEAAGGLDVLVNNAGIMDAAPDLSVADTAVADVERVFATNVFGLVRVTQAFLPLLHASAAPVIVNVSSGLGSIELSSDPDHFYYSVVSLGYPVTKTTVNSLTAQYAKALPNIRINAIDPGYTATDLNGHSGHQTVTEGTDAIVEYAQLTPEGPTGTFISREGEVPW